jgi:hypothetical protein
MNGCCVDIDVVCVSYIMLVSIYCVSEVNSHAHTHTHAPTPARARAHTHTLSVVVGRVVGY